MLIAQNVLPLISLNTKIHNFLATPLYTFPHNNIERLQVSKKSEGRYIAKTIFGIFFFISLWMQIFYKINSLKISDVIQALLVTGSISLHFIFVIGHFNKRHEIANLFNEFVLFEKRHNGNKYK